jgi:hypothetical protein
MARITVQVGTTEPIDTTIRPGVTQQPPPAISRVALASG